MATIEATVLTVTHPDFAAVVRQLIREPSRWVVRAAGLSRRADGVELLVRPAGAALSDHAARVVFAVGTDGEAVAGPVGGRVTALVTLPSEGHGTVQARFVRPDGSPQPLREIRIIGPGLPTIPTAAGHAPVSQLPNFPISSVRWSRTVGALGEAAWRRLTALRYALVGVGRTGSIVATSLVRTGVSHLTLIDPDEVEAHNLDMDGVTEADVGRPKAEAVAAALRSIRSEVDVKICPESVTSVAALPPVKESDILICCADNDGARWTCGLLAALYLKPLLDIGTGVFGGEGRGGKGIHILTCVLWARRSGWFCRGTAVCCVWEESPIRPMWTLSSAAAPTRNASSPSATGGANAPAACGV